MTSTHAPICRGFAYTPQLIDAKAVRSLREVQGPRPSMLATLCASVFLALIVVGLAAMFVGLWAVVQFFAWAVSLWGAS